MQLRIESKAPCEQSDFSVEYWGQGFARLELAFLLRLFIQTMGSRHRETESAKLITSEEQLRPP